jgi:hypothetical protein
MPVSMKPLLCRTSNYCSSSVPVREMLSSRHAGIFLFPDDFRLGKK